MARGGYQKRRIEAKHERERLERRKAARRRKIVAAASVVGGLAVIGLIAWALLSRSNTPSLTNPDATGSEQPLAFPTPCTPAGPETLGQKQFSDPPCQVIDTTSSYAATLETSKGDIVVNLLAADAPVTVNNFVFLAQSGYYDGSVFHRVIPGFGGPGSNMIQGGDAQNGDGSGGPGYQFGDENPAPFDGSGLLAMANAGPGTNGSQFFFVDGAVAHLNAPGACPAPSGCHTVFARVVDGLEVVGAIANVKTGEGDRPVNDVILERVTIEETA
ncbi:MAG TPA: peptidylprolyl isomerase [Actinomycetota bacterium]